MSTADVSELIDQAPVGSFQLRVFLMCAAVVFLDGIDYQVIGIAAPLIVRELGFSPGLLGWILFAGPFGATCGGLACGVIADRFGRRRTLIASAAIFGVATLATTQANSLLDLVALRFITGLGLGGAVPSAVALTSEFAPARRRAAIVSALWAGFPLGAMLGAFANAYLLRHGSWRVLFEVWGASPAAVAVILWLALPESIRFLLLKRAANAQVGTIIAKLSRAAPASGTIYFSSEERFEGAPVKGLFSQGRTAGTLPLWFVSFVILGSFTVVSAWTPALLAPLGFTASETALVIAFNGLGSFIGTSAAGRLMERIGVAASVIPAFLLSAVSLVLFGFSASSTLVVATVCTTVAGLFMGLASSSVVALAALIYPTAIRGTGVGWAMSSGRLGAMVGPLAVGAMVSAKASVTQIFLVMAAALVLAVPFLLQLVGYRRRLSSGSPGTGRPDGLRS